MFCYSTLKAVKILRITKIIGFDIFFKKEYTYFLFVYRKLEIKYEKGGEKS